MKKFKLVAVGGTFDHLHEGHQLLLRTAVSMGEKVAVGLTVDELLKHKKYYNCIQSYEERERGVKNFLSDELNFDNFEIFPLSDPYGDAVSNPDVEALIVSSETNNENVKVINKMRKENEFDPLDVVVIDVIRGKNGKKLSSTDFRKEINEK